MSLEKILEKIEENTEKKVSDIINDAQARADEIREKAKGEVTRYSKERIVQAREQAVRTAQREKASLLMELRQRELQKKQALIDDVFTEVERKILQQSEKSYIEFLKKNVLEAVETGTEEIIVSRADSHKISEKFLQDVNRTLRQQGKRGELRLSQETRDMRGGFILKQEHVEVNHSLEEILHRIRQEKEQEVASILFREQ